MAIVIPQKPLPNVANEIKEKLEQIRCYMTRSEHAQLMMQSDLSCTLARESCVATTSALATLSSSDFQEDDRKAKEAWKECRRLVRDTLVKRVEGWQVKVATIEEFRPVFLMI